VGWRVGQGSGVRGSGDQGEQSGSGVGWLVVKIWRSGDPEMRKRVADVFWKQSRRRRFFQGVFCWV
jgi:hypothetical protein